MSVMNGEATYPISAPRSTEELSVLLDQVSQTFNFPRDAADRYAANVGSENFRILRARESGAGAGSSGDSGGDDGLSGIIGGLALIPMGQFFGGRSVPMQGVAVVCVVPEQRASGAATSLMCEAVRELNVSGCALSTLYPATMTLYRRAGYECAGHRCEIRIMAKSIRTADIQWPIRAITEADQPALEELYRRCAMHAPGMIDRNPFMWKRVRSPRGESATGYTVINPRTNQPEAYTWLLKKESQEAPYNLHLTDVVFTSHEAGLRLISFLAHHRTMCDAIIYHGGINDPLLSLLPERAYRVSLGDHWMLRIVDVGAALSTRGYPAALSTELHLDIEDDVVVSNNGRYVLRIRNGQPTVETGGEGHYGIDIRGLAPLYSGHRSARELLLTGQLQLSRASDDADQMLDRLSAAFTGPAPMMTDAF